MSTYYNPRSFPQLSMMHMYGVSGLGSVFGTLHFVFGLSILAGAVLLVLWSSKNLKKNELKTLVELLLIIGIVGSLVIGVVSSYMGKSSYARRDKMMNPEQGLQWMMENQAPGAEL